MYATRLGGVEEVFGRKRSSCLLSSVILFRKQNSRNSKKAVRLSSVQGCTDTTASVSVECPVEKKIAARNVSEIIRIFSSDNWNSCLGESVE